MSTFLEICQDVRAQSGISGDGPTNVTGQTGIYADVVRWVEEAYNYVQTLHENWNFLYESQQITLQATFDEYDITTLRVRQIAKDSYLRQFQLGDKIRLKYVPFAEWRLNDRFLESVTGKPEFVTELPTGELRFWPIADDDYEIIFEAFSRPDIMTAGTDEPIFAAQYHDLIKLDALRRYGEYYNSQEVYKSADATFRQLIMKMQFSELPRDNLVTPTFVPFA